MGDGWKRAVEATRSTRLMVDLSIEAVALGRDDFFDLPDGEPIFYVDTKSVRMGKFAGVSRTGNIMVEIPGVKNRVSAGYKAVLLPSTSKFAWRFK